MSAHDVYDRDYDGPESGPELECADCGSAMELVPAEESQYGRPFFRCWRFPDCYGTHAAHPNGYPVGTPADARTRALRKRAHDALDPLWRDAPLLYGVDALDPKKVRIIRGRARRRTYEWLEERLGQPAHLGSADAALCRRIIFACSRATPESIRAWAHAREAERNAPF